MLAVYVLLCNGCIRLKIAEVYCIIYVSILGHKDRIWVDTANGYFIRPIKRGADANNHITSSVTAFRGDSAILPSITGEDISLAHNRRAWARLYCGWKYQWGSMAFKFTGLNSLGDGRRRGGWRGVAQIQGWNGKQGHQTQFAIT